MFVVRSIKEALREINDNQRKQEDTSENALKELVELFKSLTAQLRDSDQAAANQGLCSELLAEDIPMLLINHVIIKWDTAVYATRLITALLDFKMNDQHPAKPYFSSNFAVILEKVLNWLEELSMADCTVEILLACVIHKEMAVLMLNLEVIQRLVQLMTSDRKFADVLVTAECILKHLFFLTHAEEGAEFVLQNMDAFFYIHFQVLIENFRLREPARLVRNILYEPAYKQVMLKFVADQPQTYAAWMIEQLGEARYSIRIELWEVFKLFVAYPAKSPALKKLLIRHREKLVKYARQMIRDKNRDDPEADEENFYVIKSLEELTDD